MMKLTAMDDNNNGKANRFWDGLHSLRESLKCFSGRFWDCGENSCL